MYNNYSSIAYYDLDKTRKSENNGYKYVNFI